MKQTLLKVSACLLLAVTAFTACKKTPVEQAKTKAQASLMAKDLDDAANPNNPYDDVGYEHNEVLQGTRAIWTDQNRTLQSVYDGVQQYIVQNVSNDVHPVDMQMMQNVYNEIGNDEQSNCANYIANAPISQQAKVYVTTLESLISNPDQNFMYADVKNSIIAVEANIMQDQGLTEGDRQMLLTSASVLRHSILFWINESGNQNPAGSNPCQLRVFMNFKFWLSHYRHWWFIIHFDWLPLFGGVYDFNNGILGAFPGLFPTVILSCWGWWWWLLFP